MDFREWLIDDLPCKKNFEELLRTFDKGTFIPFIGAGPSSILGPPDWRHLLKKMASSSNFKIRLRKNFEGSIDYPKAFSHLYKKFKEAKKNSSDFFKALFDNVKLDKAGFNPLYLRIWRFFKLCVTTNFDEALRNAYTEYTEIKKSKTEIKLREYYFNWVKMDNFENSIVYLHGHKDINFAIVKKEDYDYFYPSVSQKIGIPILENFLERIYKEKTIIFIGFSFSDYYIREFFLHLAKNGKELCRKHFWITNDTCSFYTKEKILNFYEYWEQFNIFPIVYNHKYDIFVEELIALAGKRCEMKESMGKQREMKKEGASSDD